jgi:N-acetylglucosaminyldiphosphoundecaprenol N-acetyl-beta-D-mannosaminyltransferase
VKIDVLGVQTQAQTFDDAIRQLLDWANQSEGHYVCTCPVYTIMQCRENPAVMAAVNAASMASADGMPIVWMQRRLGFERAERVYGPDVMLTLCEVSQQHDISHYFWGSTPEVLSQLEVRLRARFPNISIAGSFAPPMAPAPDSADPSVVARLNESGAKVVWVGLGSPKQDLWMATYRPHLSAPLLIGVGAAFELLAGMRPQAPRWIQRSGLEWLFRLGQEPGRLWRRYLIYNPRFVLAVLRAHRFDL